jgi:hypothetical protein
MLWVMRMGWVLAGVAVAAAVLSGCASSDGRQAVGATASGPCAEVNKALSAMITTVDADHVALNAAQATEAAAGTAPTGSQSAQAAVQSDTRLLARIMVDAPAGCMDPKSKARAEEFLSTRPTP